MQEYLPALVPLTVGLGVFALGIIFALRERSLSKLSKVKRADTQQQEFDLAGGDALVRSRKIG